MTRRPRTLVTGGAGFLGSHLCGRLLREGPFREIFVQPAAGDAGGGIDLLDDALARHFIGRDGGDYSFDFYMETKHVSLARGTHKIQKLGA